MGTMTRVERRIWRAERGKFTSAGEAIDVDIDALESATERLRAADGRFLKGPVPWTWIANAAALPGRTLLVGLCIWRLAGAKKSNTVFLGNSDLKPFGIGRTTKSRALRALERAGLIKIARHPGRFPMVTLLRAGRLRKP
jgi:DNA-binding transcriptional ArsR family regulator